MWMIDFILIPIAYRQWRCGPLINDPHAFRFTGSIVEETEDEEESAR